MAAVTGTAAPHVTRPVRRCGNWLTGAALAVGAIDGVGQFAVEIGLLVGGNLLTRLILAFALQMLVRALGFHVGYPEATFILVSVSLLAGIMPVPGGIGVFEGGIAFGLVRAGPPEEAAFAVAFIYRIATFYRPPVWGFVAMRWLERNNHL